MTLGFLIQGTSKNRRTNQAVWNTTTTGQLLAVPFRAICAGTLPGAASHSLYALRCSSMDLICPIARVGFKPLGHTLTQFMMLWQRKTLKASSRSSKRSCFSVSRLSIRKRYAASSPAGPMNLSGFHQNDGQDVEQQAHRMHSYRPSSLARYSGDCRCSRAGGYLPSFSR